MLTSGNGDKSNWRIALESAVVIFLFQLLTLIQATLVSGQALNPAVYAFALTSAGVYGLVSWATARSIRLPVKGP